VKAQFKIYTNFIFSILSSQLNYNCVFISFFLTKIKQRSINMFSSSVNPNVAYYGPPPSQGQIELQAKPLPELVRKAREQIEQVYQKINGSTCERIQQKWNDFQPEKQRMLGEEPGQCGMRLGIQAHLQLAEQLRLALEKALEPMGPVMREIHRQSIEAAWRLVVGLAGIVVEIIEDETVEQGGQKIKIGVYEKTRNRLQALRAGEEAMQEIRRRLQQDKASAQQNMAQQIWRLFDFAINELNGLV
jgi:hypothetical protein